MNQVDVTITFSLVVPVYSGAKYLPDLVAQIDALRARWKADDLALYISEAIFVLDEPVDDSGKVLQQLSDTHSWLRIIELSRNYGQHSATVAGILYSSGDWVVTLDEDLQHRPEKIEKLLQKACAEGSDVVYALPREFVHGRGYRDLLSRLAKSLVSKLSGNRFIQSFNSFRLIRGDVARAASSICAQYTYFDVALTWFTQKISSVELEMSDERYLTEKRSGYRFWTLVQHAKRLVLTSDFRILRVTTAASMLSFLAAVIYGFYILYSYLFTESPVEVAGWTSLMLVVLAFGSVGVFMLGLIVDFLHMGMLQLQGKPAFFVVNRSTDGKLGEEVAKLDTSQ
jgi:glycosyltransferase involved in cell wall biosynthesis